jgi:hypothetical protein
MDYTKLIVHLVTTFNASYYQVMGQSEPQRREFHHRWMSVLFPAFNDIATPQALNCDSFPVEQFVERLRDLGNKDTQSLIAVIGDGIQYYQNAIRLIIYHCVQHIKQHRSALHQVDFLLQNHSSIVLAIQEPKEVSCTYITQQLNECLYLQEAFNVKLSL